MRGDPAACGPDWALREGTTERLASTESTDTLTALGLPARNLTSWGMGREVTRRMCVGLTGRREMTSLENRCLNHHRCTESHGNAVECGCGSRGSNAPEHRRKCNVASQDGTRNGECALRNL